MKSGNNVGGIWNYEDEQLETIPDPDDGYAGTVKQYKDGVQVGEHAIGYWFNNFALVFRPNGGSVRGTSYIYKSDDGRLHEKGKLYDGETNVLIGINRVWKLRPIDAMKIASWIKYKDEFEKNAN